MKNSMCCRRVVVVYDFGVKKKITAKDPQME